MSTVTVPYVPTSAQRPFHESTARERLLIGGFGSGKSYAVCAEAIRWMLLYPGIRGMICRFTIPSLRDSTEKVFVDLLPPELWAKCKVTRTGGHLELVIFPNGSEVMFRSLDDWRKHRSTNLGFLAIDEADEIDQETYDGMMSRLRQVDPTAEGRRQGAAPIERQGAWLAANPAGKNWLWEKWVRDNQDGERFWTRSTTIDNPYLPPEYIASLLTYPKAWVRRYVMATWDSFGGAMYESWDEDRHIIPRYPLNVHTREPEYPAGSVSWMALDPGTRSPTGGLWVVVERNPGKPVRMVAVAEYCEPGLAASEHAAAFRRIEAGLRLRPARRIADPNSVNVRDRGSNNRLSDIYRRLGYRFELGASKWPDRIPALGQMIETGQFVVTEDCPQTFAAIREARWKDLTPAARARGEDAPEEPLKKQRELVDCAEYLASRWTPGVAPKPEYAEGDWSAEFREQIMRKVRSAGAPESHMVDGIPL